MTKPTNEEISALKLPDAMAREARHLAGQLEQLSATLCASWGSSSRPGTERRIGYALKDTIAFLRDLCGPSIEEER